MSVFDVNERSRCEALVQDALRGALVTDAAVCVNGAGEIAVEMIEGRLKDGRTVSFGPPRVGDIVLETGVGDDLREMTMQADFLPSDYYGEDAECGHPKEIRIFRDGDRWCALCGPDLQEGESGFGDTPRAALADLLGQPEGSDVPEAYCPMQCDPDDGGMLPCLGADCAWYDSKARGCAVLGLGQALWRRC